MRWQMGRDMYAFWLQGRTEIACAMQSVYILPWPRPLILERKKYESSPTDHAWKLGIKMTSSIQLMLNTDVNLHINISDKACCWQGICFRHRFFLKVFMGYTPMDIYPRLSPGPGDRRERLSEYCIECGIAGLDFKPLNCFKWLVLVPKYTVKETARDADKHESLASLQEFWTPFPHSLLKTWLHNSDKNWTIVSWR